MNFVRALCEMAALVVGEWWRETQRQRKLAQTRSMADALEKKIIERRQRMSFP